MSIWQNACRHMELVACRILQAHAAGVQTLPDHHRDQFDRIIIAQAICENVTLVSGDSHAFSYRVGHSYLAHLRRVMSLALEYGAIGIEATPSAQNFPKPTAIICSAQSKSPSD